jgi:hypothetical protein
VLTPELLWTRFPYLWHMAEPGSWPSIRDHGLLSTSALLDRFGINGARRAAIEAERRPECVTILKEGMPNTVIRDQKPMSDGALEQCLQDGLKPADWYRMLNERTFFWLSQARLRRLLGARAYRDRPQTVLTLETRSIVEAHADRIELSPINSGSTIFNPVPRGRRTFLSIGEYDYEGWSKKRRAEDTVVELIVRDGVPDIKDHVIAVHDFTGGAAAELWRRRGANPSIGP